MMLRIVAAVIGSWSLAGLLATGAWLMTQGSMLSPPFSMRLTLTMTSWGTVVIFGTVLVLR